MNNTTIQELGFIYPFPDDLHNHHDHHVLYPIQKEGKWYAVKIIKGGYINIDITSVTFDNFNDCKKACDIHNNWIQENFLISKDDIEKIINWSFS